MAQDETLDSVLERIIRWMIANPEALEAQLKILRTIRPDDPMPEITQFEQVTDELKPKVRDATS